jgi:DnaJ-class molecular chaperone
MGKYENITEARKLFGINEHETTGEIKRKIRRYIKEWHPDTGRGRGDAGKEKSISLIKAKKIIMDYLDNYKISFGKDEIEKYLSPHELWMRQFGNDHIWGDGKK